jgi:hypothetical protein
MLENSFSTKYSFKDLDKDQTSHKSDGRHMKTSSHVHKFPEHTYYFHRENNFLYMPINKVACTTVKARIYELYRQKLPNIPVFREGDFATQEFHIFMGRTFSLSRFTPTQANAILHASNVFRFALVRNPADRIASAYLDKFVKSQFIKAQWVVSLPVLRCFYGERANPETDTITFRQFVNFLGSVPDEGMDLHWLPMHHFLNKDQKLFVGRLENSRDDFQFISEHAGLDIQNTRLNQTTNKRSPEIRHDAFADMSPSELRSLEILPNCQEIYDQGLLDTVKRRYRNDYLSFGYHL